MTRWDYSKHKNMITLSEFGQRIKTKFPQYSDIPDEELGGKMVEKYPEYSDMIKSDSISESKGFFGTALEKASDASEATFGRAADFLFGTAGAAVGGVIGAGVEATKELVTGKSSERRITTAFEERLGVSEDQPTPTAGKTFATAGLAALELYPGGGFVKAGLKKIGGFVMPEMVAKVVSNIPKTLQSAAVKQYSEALGATKEFLKGQTARVVPELLEKKVTALTQSGLLSKAVAQRDVAWGELEKVLEKIPNGTQIKTSAILDTLEDFKSGVIVKGTNIVAEPAVIKRVDEIKAIVEQLGDNVSFESIRSLRQIWDKAVAESKGFVLTPKEGSKLAVKKAATNSIRSELSKEFPELAKVNAEYSLWRGVEDILTETVKRKSTQSGRLGQNIATGFGASVGAATGGLQNAFFVGAVARQVAKLFNSTGWKTVSAVQKKKLADAITGGNSEQAISIMKIIEKEMAAALGESIFGNTNE